MFAPGAADDDAGAGLLQNVVERFDAGRPESVTRA